MNSEQTEAVWLHEYHEFSLMELSDLSGLSEADLRDLVDYGVIPPLDHGAERWTFSAERLVTARAACRLGKDFELDAHAVALVVTLLERIRGLEGQVRELRAKLPSSQG